MAKSIKLNAFFKTLMSIVNIVFPLLTIPYISRVLSIDGYTEYNKAASMISWFSPFAVFGVYTYGMRTISQIKNDKKAVSKLFTQLFIFSIFASIIVTIVYLLLIFFIPKFQFYKGMYALFSVQLLFICFATDWANEAYESYGFILVKTFLCRLAYLITVFVFVKKSDDVGMYVFLSSLSVVINNLLTFIYAKSKISFSRFSIREELCLIKPLFVVFLLVNSSMLYTILDKFVLLWAGDKLLLTYYNISQTIILAIVNVTSSIVLVSIPRLSFLWSNENKNEYYKVLKKTSEIFMAIHTPCCIGLACISSEVIFFYSSMKYLSASSSLLLFALRYYISAYDMMLSKQVLLATGNEKVLTKIYYIGGLYNIITKILLVVFDKLIPELCIITTASADVLVIVLQMINIKRLEIEFSIVSKLNIKYFLTSFLFVPIVLLIKYIIPFDGVKYITLRTTISIFACFVIYFIMLIITKDDFLSYLIRRKKSIPKEKV